MKNFSTIINDKDIITVEYQKNNAVLFSESQSLTDDQKNQARSNIGLDNISKHGYTDLTNEDLNTITQVGWYRAAASNACTNKPTAIGTDSFMLIVDSSNDTIIRQTLYYGTSMTSYYSRYSANAGTSWTAWSKQTTINNYLQTFIGRKTFGNGIDLNESLRAKGVDGSAGQILTASGGTLAPKWVDMPTIPANVVQYTSQTLTEDEKSQARTNIGAGTSDFSGDYNDLSNKPTIPTNYVTTDTAQDITGLKTIKNNIQFQSDSINIDTTPSSDKYLFLNFLDSSNTNAKRIGIVGTRHLKSGYAGAYLQARNDATLGIESNAKGNVRTWAPNPPNIDDSTQIANTAWVRTNYQEKGYAGVDGAVVNTDGNVTDKDDNVVDALYFKVASLTTAKTYVRTYLLAEVAMTNNVRSQATVLIRCTTESSTSAPTVTITLDNYQYDKQLLAKNIFVTADYKSGTAGATFTVWVKQDSNFMQQAWNVLSQNTRNYTTTSKREWDVFYSNITKATAVTDIDTAPTGYTRIVANNNNRYSNLEENTHLWQQAQNAGITWKRYSDDATRGIFRHYDDGTTENFVVQSDGFLFRPLNNSNTKSIKVDPKIGALYPEQNAGATLGKESQRWNNAYIQDSINLYQGSSGTPNINVVRTGLESGTNPTGTAYSNLNFSDINGKNLSVVRSQVNSAGRASTDLWTRSFGTNYGNYVGFFASPNATSADAAGVWHFSPNLNGKHDLGQSNLCWRNLYCSKSNIMANNNPDCSLIDTGLVNGTNPTAVRGAQVVGRDKNNLAITAWRGWVSKEGWASSQLYARSFGTSYSNFVSLIAKPDAASSTASNIWIFQPNINNIINLGSSSNRWANGYITNIQLCKVINGGGGNSMIQQNSDTSGATITVGGTSCPLQMQGKNQRPTYRQGASGSYNNLALQNDVPFNTVGLSTGTLGATTKLASGRYYIERDITISNHTTHVAVVVEGTGNCVYVPVRTSTAMNFISVSLITSGTNLVSVSMALHDSSGSIVDNTTVTAGTYKYKLLD